MVLMVLMEPKERQVPKELQVQMVLMEQMEPKEQQVPKVQPALKEQLVQTE